MIKYLILLILMGLFIEGILKILFDAPVATLKGTWIKREGENWSYKLIRLIAPHIPLSPYKEKTETLTLNRLGMNLTPKEYRAKILLRFFPLLVISICIVTVSPLLSLIIFLLFALLCHKKISSLEKSTSKHTDSLMSEIPQFAAYLVHAYPAERNLADNIIAYLPACNPALRFELLLLLADLRTGNADEALLAFDLRCNIVWLSHFIAALRAVVSGENSISSLDRVATDMAMYEQDMARKRAGKIPEKVERAGFFVVATVTVYLIALFLLVALKLGTAVI